jgi:hypothetical protein
MEEKYGVLPKGMVEDIYKRAGEKEVKKQEYIRNNSDVAKIIREFGGFYFNKYENVLKLELEKQFLTRYIYLCTHIDYEGKLRFKSANNKGKLIMVKDLPKVLGLSEREARNTKNALVENELIFINADKTISVNPKYAIKGGTGRKELRGSVRAMEEGIREIYEKAKPREHRRLALLMELLPYINFSHNIVCNNPNEKDIDKVDPFNLTEVMELAKYTNLTKFKRDLLNLTVNEELVIKITETKNGKFIYVNPRIFYKGNNVNDLKACMNEFRVKKQK